MLNVTEIIELAHSSRDLEEVRRETPGRYESLDGPGPPHVVVWNVCRHCNMECPHCYAAATAKPSRFALDHEEGLELLEQMAECGVRVVIFSGGEPMMRPDLIELIRAADGMGLSCHLSTNGTRLDPDSAEELADAGIGYVGVSIDGMPEFNDEYRGLEDGFELASRGVRYAQEAGLRTGIRITLTQHNLDQLESVYDHAGDLGAERFYVSHLLDAGRGYSMADADLDREQCRRTLRRLFEWAERDRCDEARPDVVTGGNDSDGAYLVRWLDERAGAGAARRAAGVLAMRGGNSAGVRILNIDARGAVHPDQFWRQVSLGNVREKSFAEILEHPLRRRLANRGDHIEGRCATCDFFEVCGGSHRERALARYGDAWASDPACVLTDDEIEIESTERLEAPA